MKVHDIPIINLVVLPLLPHLARAPNLLLGVHLQQLVCTHDIRHEECSEDGDDDNNHDVYCASRYKPEDGAAAAVGRVRVVVVRKA